MAFSAPIASNPFAPGGGGGGGPSQSNAQSRGAANSPTGPMLGPGSELRRVYNMPPTMGHASAVQCMAMVDNKVYSGGRDERLFMWQGNKPGGRDFELQQDGQPIPLTSSITSIHYEPTSKWLFLGCWRGEIQAYCKDPVKECRLEGHRRCISCLTIHSSVVISGSHDSTVRLWTANPQVGNFQPCGQPLANPTGQVHAVRVFNDGLWVGGDTGITCFDLNTLQAKGTIPSQAGVASMFNFQGYMIAAFKNGEVKIFDSAGAQTYLHTQKGEHTTNTAVEMMMHPFENKPMLLCGQEFGYVTVYDLPDFRARGTFYAKQNSDIRAILDVQADGMFLTAGHHGDIMVWQWQQQQGGASGSASVAASPFAPSGAATMGGAPVMASNPFAAAPGAPGAGGFAGAGMGGMGAPSDSMMG